MIVGGAGVVCLCGWLWYWYAYGGRASSLAESPDPEVRLQGVRELRGKWGPLARRTLKRLLDDPDSKVARWAVRAIAERPERANQQLLAGILTSAGRGKVRAEAATALGKYPDADLGLLTRTLGRDPDPSVRQGAATGLATRRDVDAIPALLERLERDPEIQVRKSSYVALRRILKVRFVYDPAAPAHQRRRQVGVIRTILRTFRIQ